MKPPPKVYPLHPVVELYNLVYFTAIILWLCPLWGDNTVPHARWGQKSEPQKKNKKNKTKSGSYKDRGQKKRIFESENLKSDTEKNYKTNMKIEN